MSVQKISSRWQIRAFAGNDIDLSALSNLVVAYENPDGDTGTINATVDTDVRYALADFTAALGDTAGTWKFELRAEDAGGNLVKSFETAEVDLLTLFG